MKYNNNQQAFFEILRGGIFPVHGEEVMVNDSFFKDVDWKMIYQLAQEQSVQGLVLPGIDSFRFHVPSFKMPQMLLLQWIGEVKIIEQQNQEMNAFIAEIIDKLRKYDIYALLVKGQGIAQCYEKPLWRACGDVDLLLSDSNYQKASNVLTEIASSVEKENPYNKHLAMTINGWAVELHSTLRGSITRIDRVIDEVQNDVLQW